MSLVQQLGSSQAHQMQPPSLCGSDLLYSTSNMCSGLHVWLCLRAPPTLRDADEGCHRHSVWGRMRLQLIAQANKQSVELWVCGDCWPGWRGRCDFNPCGRPAVHFGEKKKKVLRFSYQISAMSAEATERDAPWSPSSGHV